MNPIRVIIYYLSKKKYCCLFRDKTYFNLCGFGTNVFLSLRSVSSLLRLNLCDICMAFIFVPAILSFYAYILHPVTVGFSLRTFPVVSFKWNNSDTASSDFAVAFFPIYYLNYMTCVRWKIYAVNHRISSALPLCINYGCYLDFFEDPPRYDCAD